eukprot:Opistho-2@27279
MAFSADCIPSGMRTGTSRSSQTSHTAYPSLASTSATQRRPMQCCKRQLFRSRVLYRCSSRGVACWSSADSPYFLEAASASSSSHQSLRQLETLYVERAHSQWKEPEVLTWLQRNITLALKTVADGHPLVKSSAYSRATAYKGTPRNIHRHILISGAVPSIVLAALYSGKIQTFCADINCFSRMHLFWGICTFIIFVSSSCCRFEKCVRDAS